MECDRTRGAERRTRSLYAFYGYFDDPWEFPWEVRARMFGLIMHRSVELLSAEGLFLLGSEEGSKSLHCK